VQATLARTLAGGATVLLHDSEAAGPPGTAAAALGALPWLLDDCARRGLRAGPLGEHQAGGAAPGWPATRGSRTVTRELRELRRS
jgi:hypothetical protein